ncbi:MAG: hypothetical protein HY774_22760 [Acidobacteria bacterium]|nr:hypothetical protein [Acidobacteriota bacterium]
MEKICYSKIRLIGYIAWVASSFLALSTLVYSIGQNSFQKSKTQLIQEVLLNQPDFYAQLTTLEKKEKGTFRVAKKEEFRRFEIVVPLERQHKETVVLITKNKQAIASLLPDRKGFLDSPEIGLPGNVNFLPLALQMCCDQPTLIEKVVAEKGILLSEEGSKWIDGYECQVIKIVEPSSKVVWRIFCAKELSNLIIKVEVPSERFSYTLSEIKLVVPQELFQIPSDYKKIDLLKDQAR